MDAGTRKECCLRILSLVMEIKYALLDKPDLEMHLLEINRLLTMLEAPPRPLDIPSITYTPDWKRAEVGSTVLAIRDGEVGVERTSIPGLVDFLASDEHGIICRKNLLQNTAEYIAMLTINEVCFECLRRSSPYDLTPPLVLVQRLTKLRAYHTQCYRKIYHPA